MWQLLQPHLGFLLTLVSRSKPIVSGGSLLGDEKPRDKYQYNLRCRLSSCFSILLCRWRWQFMASHPWVIVGLFKVSYDKLRTKD